MTRTTVHVSQLEWGLNILVLFTEHIAGRTELQRYLFALVPLANKICNRQERFLGDIEPSPEGTGVIAAEGQPEGLAPARREARTDFFLKDGLHGLFPVRGEVGGQALGVHKAADKAAGSEQFGTIRTHPNKIAGSAYGHFEPVCHHPLFLFNSHGDCLAAKLRPGNVHSAEDWDELLLPEIERQEAEGKEVAFRADAAFAKPEIYDALEEHGVAYAIRIPANESLEWEVAEILFRPPGRPSHKPLVRYKSFAYQAGSWTKPRRIVAKVEHHPGELFPRVGFIVTSLGLPSRAVVRFYNRRGTAEPWIKEGKQAAPWTRLSCHRFRANEARLPLSLLAYNLGNLWRRLVLPKRIGTWSLTSLQQRLVKTGGRLIKHARYYWLMLAGGHLHRRLFGQMLRRIWALPVPNG